MSVCMHVYIYMTDQSSDILQSNRGNFTLVPQQASGGVRNAAGIVDEQIWYEVTLSRRSTQQTLN